MLQKWHVDCSKMGNVLGKCHSLVQKCHLRKTEKKMVANAFFSIFKQSHCELIVEQILLTTTTKNARGTVWRMCNLRIYSIKRTV